MKYTVLSLFPDVINAFFADSIPAKAIARGIIAYEAINIRDYAVDKHRKCDDEIYGGGAGMLMLAEPLSRALEAAGVMPKMTASDAEAAAAAPRKRVVYLSPSGRLFNQAKAGELSAFEELVLICGRYEGIDRRIIDMYVDEEISVGDYVLSSGETAALCVIDATYRLIDGVITSESLEEESFNSGLLEYPQYTRPEIFGTMKVPDVLLSGHHENIRKWRLKKQVEKTLEARPDLIRRGEELGIFDDETRKIIEEVKNHERD